MKTTSKDTLKPFVFGQSINEKHFIGREREISHLEANFTHGINTMLIAPRRWGKTSLVKYVANKIADSATKIIYIDAYFCHDEYDFYNLFAENILRQTNSRFEQWKDSAADFLTRLSPKISYSMPSSDEYSVSLGITPRTHSPQEILQLPEQIAVRKKLHLVVCIDEFQQIGEFADSMNVQKRMRSVWQHQEHVSYCLFGSKKHLMQNMFQKSSYPFYKFGDIIPLEPIAVDLWIPYLQNGFRTEGKEIPTDVAAELCQRVQLHPSYVQQLAWLTLINTRHTATIEILEHSVSDLINENSALFIQQTEHLSPYQLNFIYAMLDGIEQDFTKAEIREQYNLGSYNNISRIKQALVDKELIDIGFKGKVSFLDPVFPLWLKHALHS